jgi:hypothetical protein
MEIIMKKIGLVLSVLWLSACASPASNETAALESKQDLVCENLAPTGSNMKKKTCMTRASSEATYRNNKDSIREDWSRSRQ